MKKIFYYIHEIMKLKSIRMLLLITLVIALVFNSYTGAIGEDKVLEESIYQISDDPTGETFSGPIEFSYWEAESLQSDGNQPILTKASITINESLPESDIGNVLQEVAGYSPVWVVLEGMKQEDKGNAIINLETDNETADSLREQINNAESLWNGGKFNEAIASLQPLETDGVIMSVGISWINPKEKVALAATSSDIRIGARTYIKESHLDFHAQTGNLFAVLTQEDTATSSYSWTVNISTDEGQTWTEKYRWAATFQIKDVCASVVADFLYVGYVGNTAFDSARIRRFSVSTGLVDSTYGYKTVFNKGTAINELAMVTSADGGWNNLIYYFAVLSDHTLIYHYASNTGDTWTEVSTGVTNAWKGLDATFNEGFENSSPGYYWYVSYIASDDTNPIMVLRHHGGITEAIKVYWEYTGSHAITSISAYYDTIICAYERTYSEIEGRGIGYKISYNGGENWAAGNVAYPWSGESYFCPDVTARGGGGMAAAYQEEVGSFDQVWFKYREYSMVTWSAQQQINAYDTITGYPIRIEWVPPIADNAAAYGTIYSSMNPENRIVYFDREDVEITVSSPNGGETLYVNDTKTITWSSHNVPGNVKIEISRNGGSTWSTITSSTYNDGSYNWTVTSPLSTQCRIKITSLNYPTISDMSNSNFRIDERSITLTTPNGGETWYAGDKEVIIWSSHVVPGNVKIEISRNSGLTWAIITSSTLNDGLYAWIVPGPKSSNCLVKVTSLSYPAVTDNSNSTFTIDERSITVNSPNGGETWYAGDTEGIRWSSYALPGNVKIEVSYKGGLVWSTITSSTPNDGSYAWSVLGPKSGNCLVKVTSLSYPAVTDNSNSTFTIDERIISVNSPDGGETWFVGDPETITWSSQNITGNVKIEISRDNGSTWAFIISDISNAGDYDWTVTGPSSSQCRIKVTSLSYPAVSDISNTDFTISKATTYTVDDDGTADFSTISDALTAANSGDIIFVFPGVYNEQVVMKDRVNLFGKGPDVCTIDAGGAEKGVIFNGSNSTIISGFKITGAQTGLEYKGPLIVRNNVITGNQTAIALNFENQPIVSTIVNNTIADNDAVGIGIFSASEVQMILNNIITSNGKYGIYCSDSSTGDISYNDVWSNPINYYNKDSGTPFTPSPGTGEIHQDPLFEEGDGGYDYYLGEGSPCKDTGAPGPEYDDPDGTRNDMGAYGGPGAVEGRSTFIGSGFIFTSIGKIPTSEITQDDASDSHGLANVSEQIHTDFKIHKYIDSPFGGNLWIHGLFGDADDVDYYQILIAKYPEPDNYSCLNDPLTKVKYTINPDGTVTHQYLNLGPKTIDGVDNLYELTKKGYWTHLDLRMIWRTRSWENGKYKLSYRAYHLNPITGEIEQVPLPPNDLDHIDIVIDNSPVECIIHSVKYDENTGNPNYDQSTDGEIPECGIINLLSETENLRFTITAQHPNGYLRTYSLKALYGKNKDAGLITSQTYDGTSPPLWYGVQEEEFQSEDSGNLDDWQRCAYQFRLRVHSRTTNGYGYIIWKEFNDHYYLDIGGETFNLCNGDFDNDGDVDGFDLADFATDFGRNDCLPE